jgi:hypothetical protein
LKKAGESILEIGKDTYNAASNRADHALDSVPSFLNYVTLGIPSGIYNTAQDRAARMKDSPSDFANWLTAGTTGMIKETFKPEEPLSPEHLLNSLGTAFLVAGGVKSSISTESRLPSLKSTNEEPITKGTGKIDLTIKPSAENQKLQNAIDQLYRPNATVGNGSTMDAIRHELKTGELVGGKGHMQKGQERAKNLENILNKETLNPQDKALAETLLQDLNNAISGK